MSSRTVSSDDYMTAPLVYFPWNFKKYDRMIITVARSRRPWRYITVPFQYVGITNFRNAQAGFGSTFTQESIVTEAFVDNDSDTEVTSAGWQTPVEHDARRLVQAELWKHSSTRNGRKYDASA